MLSPLPILLAILVLISYSFLLSASNTIPRSHNSILLPRFFQHVVGRNVSCQAFIVFDSDSHSNTNALPLPLFLDEASYPECFLSKNMFSSLVKNLNFARRLDEKLVSRLFTVLGKVKLL